MLNPSIRRVDSKLNKKILTNIILALALLSLLVWLASSINFTSPTKTASSLDYTAQHSNLILSGVLGAQINISAENISCTNNKMEILLSATNGLNGYRISLTNNSLLTAENNFSSIDDSFTLELIDQNNKSYSSFKATEGNLYLNTSSGTMTGFLVNEYSQQAFISLSWMCP